MSCSVGDNEDSSVKLPIGHDSDDSDESGKLGDRSGKIKGRKVSYKKELQEKESEKTQKISNSLLSSSLSSPVTKEPVQKGRAMSYKKNLIKEMADFFGSSSPVEEKPAKEKVSSAKEKGIYPITSERGDYDTQVVLNLGSGRSALGIKLKAEKKRGKFFSTSIIDIRRSEPDYSSLGNLTHQSRLYITGHGESGSDEVKPQIDFSDLNSGDFDIEKNFDVEWFAEVLANNAEQLKNHDGGRKIRISMVVCYSGQEDDASASLGEKLCLALHERGIPAEVVARRGKVSRWKKEQLEEQKEGKREYEKRVDYKHHKTGDF